MLCNYTHIIMGIGTFVMGCHFFLDVPPHSIKKIRPFPSTRDPSSHHVRSNVIIVQNFFTIANTVLHGMKDSIHPLQKKHPSAAYSAIICWVLTFNKCWYYLHLLVDGFDPNNISKKRKYMMMLCCSSFWARVAQGSICCCYSCFNTLIREV